MLPGGRDIRVAEEYRSVRRQEADRYRLMKLAGANARSKPNFEMGVLIRLGRSMRNRLLYVLRGKKTIEVERNRPPQKSPSLEPSG
jgi:hypothetical protein